MRYTWPKSCAPCSLARGIFYGLSSKRASVYRTLVIRKILQDFVRMPFLLLSPFFIEDVSAESSGRGNATYVCVDSSSAAMRSAGVSKLRVLRGRRLSCMATNSRSSALWTFRSVLLGKYCRSRPLVFSLVPLCHGEPGSQKYTGQSVAMEKDL